MGGVGTGWGEAETQLENVPGRTAPGRGGHSSELISAKFIVSREKQTNDRMIGSLYAKEARVYPQRRGKLLVRFKHLGQDFEICFSNAREDGLETGQWSVLWLLQ